MTDQLYVQSTVTFHLIATVIETSTLFYAQRRPAELGNFHWVIDGKDRNRITDWEDWWSFVVRPMLQAKSLRAPMIMLQDADYSHFERFDTTIGDHLKPYIPDRPSDNARAQATDINKLMTESFRFCSGVEPGLEMVDVLVNATRRAMMGHLEVGGWSLIPSLMVHRKHHYIGMVELSTMELSTTTLTPRGWPYMSVLRQFSRGGRYMLAPRFSRKPPAA
jgi:hypothetical protein